MQEPRKITQSRSWKCYPVGTKVHSVNGGFWIRLNIGWKWHTGEMVKCPGKEAVGNCIELPAQPSMSQEKYEKTKHSWNRSARKQKRRNSHRDALHKGFGMINGKPAKGRLG